ncbi:MAG: phage baseplate assembly protein [Xanthomonadaceae bacterium]|nr:phage baseplate assembly protein [Xanthomonadaceae bacterium]
MLQRLDATQTMPTAQVTGLADEQLQMEWMQHYGFASVPLSTSVSGDATRHMHRRQDCVIDRWNRWFAIRWIINSHCRRNGASIPRPD